GAPLLLPVEHERLPLHPERVLPGSQPAVPAAAPDAVERDRRGQRGLRALRPRGHAGEAPPGVATAAHEVHFQTLRTRLTWQKASEATRRSSGSPPRRP